MFIFSCLSVLKEVKRVFAFSKIFRFDPGSSKVIIKQNIKNVSLKYGAILLRQIMPSSVPS